MLQLGRPHSEVAGAAHPTASRVRSLRSATCDEQDTKLRSVLSDALLLQARPLGWACQPSLISAGVRPHLDAWREGQL